VSFFVNAGIRFVEETCKMRAFGRMWDKITKERYGVETAKYRLFRYGVQVNSLGLTEEQPENNAWRILIETLGVTLSRNARCRALQLPAWNEALSLPAPVGPAVGAPPPAGPRVRDRPARVSRPLRRLAGRRSEGRRAGSRGVCRDRQDPGDGWRAGRDRLGLHEERARAEPGRAARAHQPRRDHGRRSGTAGATACRRRSSRARTGASSRSIPSPRARRSRCCARRWGSGARSRSTARCARSATRRRPART
jgi:hypothetical protein